MASPAATNSQAATEATRLQALDVDVQDQDDVERGITRKVSFISASPSLSLLCTKLDTGG